MSRGRWSRGAGAGAHRGRAVPLQLYRGTRTAACAPLLFFVIFYCTTTVHNGTVHTDVSVRLVRVQDSLIHLGKIRSSFKDKYLPSTATRDPLATSSA